MLSAIRSVRSLSRTAQLLLLNQFGVNLGFYLLFPYLATHLRENLHLSTGVIGAVLGARSLSQQGLTLFGGSPPRSAAPLSVRSPIWASVWACRGCPGCCSSVTDSPARR